MPVDAFRLYIINNTIPSTMTNDCVYCVAVVHMLLKTMIVLMLFSCICLKLRYNCDCIINFVNNIKVSLATHDDHHISLVTPRYFAGKWFN